MEVLDLMRDCPGLTVSVRVEDLRSFGAMLIAEAQKAAEEAQKKKKEVTLLTREEVCAKLKITPSTLWRWKQKGYLVPLDYGGQYRYRDVDVMEIMEGR